MTDTPLRSNFNRDSEDADDGPDAVASVRQADDVCVGEQPPAPRLDSEPTGPGSAKDSSQSRGNPDPVGSNESNGTRSAVGQGDGGDSGDSGEHEDSNSPTPLEVALYLPVGLSALAREAIERLIAEGTARGELEVGRVRNAVENEIEIARSVGRARVRRLLGDPTSRLEYPPLSIVAEVVRAAAEMGREALEELQSIAQPTAFPGIRRARGESDKTNQTSVDLVGSHGGEEVRGRGLASLKTAQRAAASRVLKARFENQSSGAGDRAGGGGQGGEVVRVTFADDFGDEDSAKSSSGEGQESETGSGSEKAVRSSPPQSLADYDSLSAQQIVARLGGLSIEELNTVVEYESATKSRAAVIERARQELSSREAADQK